jgi:predicted GNAT family acetyltransferase
MPDPVITHRPEKGGARGSFDLEVDGKRAGFLSYSLDGDDTIVVDYVQVDPSLRGQRLGDRLVAAAVEWARANHRRILPICSFARAVMRRTKEYQDVLKK